MHFNYDSGNALFERASPYHFIFSSLASAVALVVPHQSTVPPPFPERCAPLRSTHADRFAPPQSRRSSSSSSGLLIMFLRVNISVKPQPFRRLLLKARVFRSFGYKNKLALWTLTHTF